MRNESVLIIDDDKIARDSLETLLEIEGFDVRCCDSGPSAVELLCSPIHFSAKEIKPPLQTVEKMHGLCSEKRRLTSLLLTFKLPTMNGLQLLCESRFLNKETDDLIESSKPEMEPAEAGQPDPRQNVYTKRQSSICL